LRISTFFEGLKQSFEEAIAFKKGDESKARVHQIDQDNSLISKLIKSETLSEPLDVTPPIH
jgi:hypothetical protein